MKHAILSCCLLFVIPLATQVAANAQPAATAEASAKLLEAFRGEFLEITPGTDRYPASWKVPDVSAKNVSESATREIAPPYPFAIGRFEVTQEVWRTVMDHDPSRWKGPRHSVEMISYNDAVRFCALATKRLRELKLIRDDQIIRLPRETEWEYAIRAGTTTVYSYGDNPELLGTYAWYTGNAAGNDPPVGAKEPNPWGLYDVHGYLWEWCQASAPPGTAGTPSETPPAAEQRAILRGGSWKDAPEQCTSATRRLVSPDLRDDAVGLRCVLCSQEQQ